VIKQDSAAPQLEAIGFYVINQRGIILGKGPFSLAPEVVVSLQIDVKQAPYLIVPCTFEPGQHFSHIAFPVVN